MNEAMEVLRDLIEAIDKRFGGETQRKTDNCISPLMADAIKRARIVLAAEEEKSGSRRQP